MDLSTENIYLDHGKFVRWHIRSVPDFYIKKMINYKNPINQLTGIKWYKYAEVEIERRGLIIPIASVEMGAVDKASQCVLDLWQKENEERMKKGKAFRGLYTWLVFKTDEAVKKNVKEDGMYILDGMFLIIEKKRKYPVLKSVAKDKSHYQKLSSD